MNPAATPLPTDHAPRGRHLPAEAIRSRFSQAMSQLYRAEVPQYGTLLSLVAAVNAQVLREQPDVLAGPAEAARLEVERHGAIRLGTAEELHTMRRVFAVMGMQPVGYYDLSVAGVPVHSTAFRPVDPAALAANPFRVFTSLLRLDLIEDPALRQLARDTLARRRIFTPQALALTTRWETAGGLDEAEAEAFVQEVLNTFRWHRSATVTQPEYQRLSAAHRLLADVVCFPGPHINHLTPRTLDIDAAQAEMQRRGLPAKEVIEGPPRRQVPILLRQTSFKALNEPVRFAGDSGDGAHTARFGEIEQRGLALTRAGRALYDTLLQRARQAGPGALAQVFTEFPDDLDALRRAGLGFFQYRLKPGLPSTAWAGVNPDAEVHTLVDQGLVQALPITYEDFLPVSAAGIFQSNLAGDAAVRYDAQAAQAEFEQALGCPVHDEFALYEAEQAASIATLREQLRRGAAA
ncbi:2-oxoadipate dioxygenase/decarboxylase HglS [Aquincola tertiaricarbonis]|nr:VOC family protein [Aquincola tertiaricarbonis]